MKRVILRAHISDKLNFTLMGLFLLVFGQLGSGIVFKKMNFMDCFL